MNHEPEPHFYTVVLKINMRVTEGITWGEETSIGIRYFGKPLHYCDGLAPAGSETTRPLPLPNKGSEIQSPKTEIRKGLIQQSNSNTTNNNNNNNSNSDSNEQSKIATK